MRESADGLWEGIGICQDENVVPVGGATDKGVSGFSHVLVLRVLLSREQQRIREALAIAVAMGSNTVGLWFLLLYVKETTEVGETDSNNLMLYERWKSIFDRT